MQQDNQWPFSLHNVVHTDAIGDDIAMLPCLYAINRHKHAAFSCKIKIALLHL